MKSFAYFSLAAAASLALAAGCSGNAACDVTVTEEIINSGYVGNGLEWDPYDEALSWGCEVSDEDWDKIFSRLDFMRPQYVRCMINSPFTYYDAETGSYDKNRNIRNITKLLTYCQENGIMVIYGEYNPPEWEMKDSPRWVEMSVNYLDHLVNVLGFDCIRHFVIFNEPDGNWASTDGDYGLWKKMAGLFIAEMDKYPGLSDKVDLAGPDAVMNYRNPASEFDTEGWIRQTAEDLDEHVGIYDIHAYPGQHYVRSGEFGEKLREIRAAVPEGKKILFGEAGYKYHDPEDSLLMQEYRRRVKGHPFTKGSDCNMLCYDYFYALDMPLFLIETMNNGFSGAAAWMLDDAMHSNGDSGRTEDIKIWGMWNILGEEVFGDPSQEDVRPWYYTWSMMCRHFPAGCDILKVESGDVPGLHFAAASKDGKHTLAAINLTEKDFEMNFMFPGGLQDGIMYIYSEHGTEFDENGLPVPVRTGIASRKVEATIPAGSFLMITDLLPGDK